MRLIEYQVSKEQSVTDAVFVDAWTGFWHFQFQRVETAVPGTADTSLPRIRFSHQLEKPKTGVVHEEYQRVMSAGQSHQVAERRWFELLLAAFRTASGWEAITLTFVL